MGFLANKRALITGMISNRSIAYGIAIAMKREGAELAFTYQNDKIKDRVVDLAKEFGSDLVFPCDVGSDEQIEKLFVDLGKHWDGLDSIIHSIVFVPKAALAGDYVDSVTREYFQIAHDISSYSFTALAKAGLPMMAGRNASLLTLSYLGAERTVPHYNVMGLAKASLEANVRYMAADLGPKGIRVNGLSAGPIKTLAASGVHGLSKMLEYHRTHAPLRKTTDQEEVGDAALFLVSHLSRGVTGEVIHVDGGFHVMGMAAL